MPTVIVTIFAGVIYIVIILISVANIINPKWVWHTFESHTAIKEPTKAYFIMRRIFATIGLVLASCLILMPIIAQMS